MPSLRTNRRLWTRYDWSGGGEEWSAAWGTTHTLWHGTIMPRIGAFLTGGRTVEIGPGYGRLTTFLKDVCAPLVAIDIAPNCIEHCRRRFAAFPHVECWVNDGSDLAMVQDASTDFVFSFDSLVHADMDVVRGYLAEIGRVLVPGGCAVLHHSNLAEVAVPARGHHDHLRARDVSAARVLDATAEVQGLQCCVQELVSWDATGRLIDCISVFARTIGPAAQPPTRIVTPTFFAHAREMAGIATAYGAVAVSREPRSR